MAKRTKKGISDDFREIINYKWQFLRRNNDYIRDCEKHCCKDRKYWNKREIILGYKFGGKRGRFDIGGKLYSKELWNYYDRYYLDFGNLTADKKEDKLLREIKFNPPQTPGKYTWNAYSKKWLINLPLNPNCSYVPFFVSIASINIITEPVYCSRVNNDILLERSTSSFICVNWAMHKKYLEYKFKEILEQKQRYLKNRKIIKDKRTQFAFFDSYLAIWDLRNKKMKYEDISETVFPNDNRRNKWSAVDKTKKAFKEAKELIDGGYKKIGGK